MAAMLTLTPRTLRRRTAAAAVLATAAAGLAAASPASALSYEDVCGTNPDTVFADGSITYSNAAGEAGCVTAHVFLNGNAELYRVQVQPGWSYQVKSNGGSTDGSRVEVLFTRGKDKVSVRMEAGRTVIK